VQEEEEEEEEDGLACKTTTTKKGMRSGRCISLGTVIHFIQCQFVGTHTYIYPNKSLPLGGLTFVCQLLEFLNGLVCVAFDFSL
jgi:hypothetical protein